MISEDNSGTFGILAGLIALVFVGVGLSALIDRSSGQQKSAKGIQQDIAVDAERLQNSKEVLERKRFEADVVPLREQQAARFDELTLEIAAQRARITDLRETLAAGRAGLKTLEDGFLSYGATYREQSWLAAIGEHHALIALRSGVRYADVTIARVTAAGLEITYADGRARINAGDLDASWQDRFQWNETERTALLKREFREAASLDTPREPVKPDLVAASPSEPSPEAPAEVTMDAAAVRKAHLDLGGWDLQVSTLKTEYEEASRQAHSANRNSVPGSLETWDAKVVRLSAQLDRARMNQAKTRASLELLAPLDPLLRKPR